ncbi:MAG: GNAT family N-acetyltransferase [Bdellovibrionota bacterium]|nr:MAG: GNAT family N-acetyltransferase [Pseudomonadota bacterium]
MELKIRLVQSLAEIDPKVWRRLQSPDFPFNDLEFFQALDSSGSIGKGTGWQSLYLLAENQAGVVVGILYCFIKQHSYGEYIFDWQWANFYQAHGASYYPKLLTSIPFTPATGPRILVDPETDSFSVRTGLIAAALELSQKSGLSSYHALFLEKDEQDYFEQRGLSIRHSLQYHWHNQGYRDFQDFLDSLIGKRRRDIVRERKRAQSHGLTIEALTGSDLKPEHASIMNALYQTTTDKKNAIAYLQPGFFDSVFDSMKDRILFVLASDHGRPVAGALNFYKGNKLYGRYWGSLEPFADLHFELCYYQTIDFALRQNLAVFEAGAQGEHKVQRGFLPSTTYSAHKLFDARFAQPIVDFIDDERRALDELRREYSNPYRLAENSNGKEASV